MNNFQVIKLDRRYHGHKFYTHAIDFSVGPVGLFNPRPTWIDRVGHFIDARIWFWDTFGPSSELDFINYESTDAPVWAWKFHDSRKIIKIYVKDETILSHFLLKHLT